MNFSARTVISPDPYISMNEVGVPKEIAMELTVPIRVNEFNFQLAKDFVLSANAPDEELVIGEVIALAIQACEAFVLRGLEKAMNEVNWQILGQKG